MIGCRPVRHRGASEPTEHSWPGMCAESECLRRRLLGQKKRNDLSRHLSRKARWGDDGIFWRAMVRPGGVRGSVD